MISAIGDAAARPTTIPVLMLNAPAAQVADEVVVGDLPIKGGAATLGDLFGRLKSRGIERISIEKGASGEELVAAVESLSLGRRTAIGSGILKSLDAIAEGCNLPLEDGLKLETEKFRR